ncbi:hypothetical protein PQC07_gp253 [Aeromonas phage D3]|uniref:Uncharacterized protein n=3 Tax=Ludhianavirus TaxID=3044751 RepID=A0A514A1S0_9CAUD|nr:hypothetical protein PQC06_gp192 [Aeromonas phage LAh10]YP_010668503.1 hypothetical protein PQC07_gp253 [Aeromonas phage D3]YP_010668771.1 hypothetical protein PQC08_gp252 [Aeromonas phage D6]QEP52327.1 hypothetical protein D9_0120 [Aeromonas phage D9]QDH47221.1 hypothetical protein LAh10_191 [Aeromonas phage LAh10]QDJ97021.1 hypothetical protein D3_0022 [Aeromonas phage D3]QDJ97183.1 hypothetical protein D6_0023 [Aeromonas phage D6]
MSVSVNLRSDAITPKLAKEMNGSIFIRSNTFSVRQRAGNITLGLHGISYLKLPKMNTNAKFSYLEEPSDDGEGVYWTCSLAFYAKPSHKQLTTLVIKTGFYHVVKRDGIVEPGAGYS